MVNVYCDSSGNWTQLGGTITGADVNTYGCDSATQMCFSSGFGESVAMSSSSKNGYRVAVGVKMNGYGTERKAKQALEMELMCMNMSLLGVASCAFSIT